jgi:hypothetical protein
MLGTSGYSKDEIEVGVCAEKKCCSKARLSGGEGRKEIKRIKKCFRVRHLLLLHLAIIVRCEESNVLWCAGKGHSHFVPALKCKVNSWRCTFPS